MGFLTLGGIVLGDKQLKVASIFIDGCITDSNFFVLREILKFNIGEIINNRFFELPHYEDMERLLYIHGYSGVGGNSFIEEIFYKYKQWVESIGLLNELALVINESLKINNYYFTEQIAGPTILTIEYY